MIIPKHLIELAAQKGACAEAIKWLQAEPRTFRQLVSHEMNWATWAIENLLTASAEKAYKAAMALGEEAYKAATAPAREAYNTASAPAWEAYKAATAPAWEAYEAAMALALEKAFAEDSASEKVPAAEVQIP